MDAGQLIPYLIAAIAAAWALFRELAPRITQARLVASKDEQEHRQKQEELKLHYATLDNAGWSSKASELLELHESFLREQVWKKLEAIEVVMGRFEYTQSQIRDELAVLNASLMKLEDILKRQ